MKSKKTMQGEIDDLTSRNLCLEQENSVLRRDNQSYKKDNQQLRRDNTSLRHDNKTLIGIIDRGSHQAQQVHHHHSGCTQLSYQEVARQCGYKTINGLSKFMERNLNCTAREYRENRTHGNRSRK